MKKWQIGMIAAVVLILAFAVPYGIRRYKMDKMTETDLFSMGQVVANKGDCRKAIEYFETLLRHDPRHTVAMDFLASCQIRLKDTKGAIETLEVRNRLEPQPKPLELLASLYDQTGQKGKAEEARKRAQAMAPPESAPPPAHPSPQPTAKPPGQAKPRGSKR